MIDPVGTILSWIVIVGSLAYITYNLARVMRTHRLEVHNAAGIMFGTGWLVLELPEKVYNLPPDALSTLNWLGIAIVLASIALELSSGRFNRHGRAPGSS